MIVWCTQSLHNVLPPLALFDFCPSLPHRYLFFGSCFSPSLSLCISFHISYVISLKRFLDTKISLCWAAELVDCAMHIVSLFKLLNVLSLLSAILSFCLSLFDSLCLTRSLLCMSVCSYFYVFISIVLFECVIRKQFFVFIFYYRNIVHTYIRCGNGKRMEMASVKRKNAMHIKGCCTRKNCNVNSLGTARTHNNKKEKQPKQHDLYFWLNGGIIACQCEMEKLHQPSQSGPFGIPVHEISSIEPTEMVMFLRCSSKNGIKLSNQCIEFLHSMHDAFPFSKIKVPLFFLSAAFACIETSHTQWYGTTKYKSMFDFSLIHQLPMHTHTHTFIFIFILNSIIIHLG